MTADKQDSIRNRKSNSERLIVMLMFLLTRAPGIKTGKSIRKKISEKIEMWEYGKLEELFSETHHNAKNNLRKKRGHETPAQRACTFNRMVMRGKIRSAAQYITARESGGVLTPSDNNTKKYPDGRVRSVLKTLQSKHPEA